MNWTTTSTSCQARVTHLQFWDCSHRQSLSKRTSMIVRSGLLGGSSRWNAILYSQLTKTMTTSKTVWHQKYISRIVSTRHRQKRRSSQSKIVSIWGNSWTKCRLLKNKKNTTRMRIVSIFRYLIPYRKALTDRTVSHRKESCSSCRWYLLRLMGGRHRRRWVHHGTNWIRDSIVNYWICRGLDRQRIKWPHTRTSSTPSISAHPAASYSSPRRSSLRRSKAAKMKSWSQYLN